MERFRKTLLRLIWPACCITTLSGCPEGTEDAFIPGLQDPCDHFESRLLAQDPLQRNALRFGASEPIVFELQITNSSSSPQTLTAPDTCPPVRFEIRDSADRTVWSSEEDLACEPARGPTVYPAGNTLSFRVQWQPQAGSSPAQAGSYTAHASVHVAHPAACAESLSKSLPFSVY